ncbi:MAG TPA: hemin uptake protein HemP [Rhodocyclaceae bacterium]|nr:hemin uptake protein HemP [Rhodocyclaceae bacterium]
MNQPPSRISTPPRHSAADCLSSDAAPIAATNAAADTCPPVTRTLLSQALFGNASEICIHHMGTDYRLRITRQDKLILTK